MPLTPIDIRKKTFGSQLRGLSAKEVKSFLELVAKEMEQLRKERALLAEKVDELSANLERYERTEDLLKNTLVTAQKTTDELTNAAREKSEAMLRQAEQDARERQREAEKQADEIIARARAAADKLSADIKRLEAERSTVLHQIRGVTNSFLAMVEKWESRIEQGPGDTPDED